MTDFRAELQLLFDDAESFAEASLGRHYLWVAALNRARAALAEQPVGPTDEELWEAWGCFEHEPFSEGDTIMQLREFLAKWGQP
jgi:hypothetical protein